MNFIDHTGHIFSLESYSMQPIGYEYDENKYIFWFDTEYGYKLSVNNYYFKPIRCLLPISDETTEVQFSVESNSKVFKLFGSKQIQQLLETKNNYKENINIDEDDFNEKSKAVLTNEDVLIINTIKEYSGKQYNVPHYVYYDDGIKIRYNGPKPEIVDGVRKGVVNFGPLSKEVMLYVDFDSIPINDESQCVHTIVNRKYIEGVHAPADELEGDVKSVVFNRNQRCVNMPYSAYKNTFLGDVEKDEFDFETIIVDGKTYVVENVYKHYALVPFYVVFNSMEEGVWETNLLIHTTIDEDEEWCPITIGAECVDEIEELVINGKNMGINLPKQIIKAVYQSSYYAEYPDERLYANKLKEYLMNFMQIKGEQGNFRSAINSLKWFGWGDKVTINKLWKTDNILQNKYIRDNFDISNDTIYSYQCFRNSTLVSLSVRTNQELDEGQHDFSQELWGEGKSTMENLFEKDVVIHYDEQDIDFYRGWFDYAFDELGLKLCALKYYYQKYFLPIHLNIGNASLEHQQHINDVKMITKACTMFTEVPVLTNEFINTKSETLGNKHYKILLPTDKYQYLMCQTHFIDSNYCEFNGSYKFGTVYDENIYYINDTVVNIPIQFEQDIVEQYYNCYLILTKDNTVVHECAFQFVQNLRNRDSIFRNFVIHPKTLNTVITGKQDAKYDLNYWVESDYVLYLRVNNVWYQYKFNMKFPEVNMHLGRLEYKYYLDTYPRFKDLYGKVNLFKQIDGFGKNDDNTEYIKFNSFMFQPDLVNINNMDFIKDLMWYTKENNLNYVNVEDMIEAGRCYFYIEYDGKQYIFAEDSTKVFVGENNSKVFTVAENSEVKIRRRSNGTYTLRIKHYEDPRTGIVGPMEVSGLTLKSTLYHDIKDYVNRYYTVTNNFVDDKYLNRCHLVDIYEEDEEGNFKPMYYKEPVTGDEVETIDDIAGKNLSFEDNSSPYVVGLYKTFFNNNGDSILDATYEVEGNYITLNRFGNMFYDLYLMHDKSQWYFVMISRTTIKNFTESALKFELQNSFTKHRATHKANVLTVSLDSKTGDRVCQLSCDESLSDEWTLKIVDNTHEEQKNYYLKYNRSDSKILINRLQYVDSEGVNHFETGDIIGCTLVNNNKLPFKLGLGSKWTFTPMSYGMVEESYVESPTEMAIVSIGNENVKYSKGYYTVTCNYSFDDFIQHGFEKKGKFRID